MSPEKFVPQDHPLRAIKPFVDEAVQQLSPLLDEMYAELGRPSIPPERLLKAKLLQAFYTIRSEVLLVEMLHYNLLFRWSTRAQAAANCFQIGHQGSSPRGKIRGHHRLVNHGR